jgi:hypothetical protein
VTTNAFDAVSVGEHDLLGVQLTDRGGHPDIEDIANAVMPLAAPSSLGVARFAGSWLAS